MLPPQYISASVKQGNTAQPWTDVITSGTEPVDLTGATIRLHIIKLTPDGEPYGEAVVRNAAAVVGSELDGEVTYTPVAEDVETPGLIGLEWHAVLADLTEFVFPTVNTSPVPAWRPAPYIIVEILPAI